MFLERLTLIQVKNLHVIKELDITRALKFQIQNMISKLIFGITTAPKKSFIINS